MFTYPGPNPFTKETAILMMADAVEAASRSLTEYTEESIGQLVDKIIDSQVDEGYFKECPITFKDIAVVKSVFKEKLKIIYHTRVKYPELKR
jgi:membrane-associated HD superfamily phosphohydrolase